MCLPGCSGRHYWFSGASEEAQSIETLAWILFAGAGVIWLIVMALAFFAMRSSGRSNTEKSARRMILWGGFAFPTVVLAALLGTGLLTLKSIVAERSDLTLEVEGEQWWWRVGYPGGVVTANEVRLPRGRTAEILLTADDVIHSFWAPALGGKIDMIPGRENRLTLTPTTVGNWGGLCAEYCGGAHAQMRFNVIVMEPDAFDAWLEDEAAPAQPESGPGLEAFLGEGCGACHTIRGTEAQGLVGPDLTHFGARTSLGAGILALDRDTLRHWITHTDTLKPGVKMPAYPDIPTEELEDMIDYLLSLT
ncbi:cytochrome c oxidase subunit 2 [Poseidonocella pacifica]|uniref:Cytochrome aa3 subunit 2 n=1 Tax=Poseidonocella pacifica TaxID=871651 RepID=A0A1I0YEC2_9RHOB|nr:cytochrome c oxidase subunit II [Poseidonocella pacifica]SFB11137.1 cytochrome c oxidase subunit 2 [Poseidonocella pacifica]